jgi:hypothetical protein
MQSARYFCPILTKFGIPRYIFIEVTNIQFHVNPSSGRCAESIHVGGRRDGLTMITLSRNERFYGDLKSPSTIKRT